MKIKIREKKDSLESIILGISSNPYRTNFHKYLELLETEISFEVLDDSNLYALIVQIDDNLHEFTEYPNAEETANLFGLELELFNNVTEDSRLLQAANTTRLGNCCGVGQDIYCDPNEEN